MSTNTPRSGAVAIPAVAAAMLYSKPAFKPKRDQVARNDDTADPVAARTGDQKATALRPAESNRR